MCWDGRSHVRQEENVEMMKAKGRPEGLRMCLGGAEKVNAEERKQGCHTSCRERRKRSDLLQNTRIHKGSCYQKTDCEHNHISMNPLKGRRP